MIDNINLNPFAISGLLIAVTSLGLIIILLRYGKTKIHKMWALFNLSIIIWGIGGFFAGSSVLSDVSLFWWRFSHIGVIAIPIFLFHGIYLLCGLKNKIVLFFVYFQGLIFALLIPTKLFFKGATFMFSSFYYPILGPIYHFFFILWITIVLVAHYNLFLAFRDSRGSKRMQILYFFTGVTLGLSGGLTNFLPGYFSNIYPYGNFLIPIYCIIVTYAILKHQLMDIKIVIQKSFVYSVLIALITATYFVFVFLAERLFQEMVGYSSLVISILYAFVIALFFNPVRNKIQHFADKIFLGKDPMQIARENELMRQELERSERLKAVATFASGMAHEIKNPLTSIKTFTEYLPKKKNDSEFLNKFSKIVSGEVNRIDSLVHQLLDFAKPAPLNLQAVDIHKLLDNILGFLNNDFIKYRIKVIKDYNTDEHGLKSTDDHGLNISGNSSQISGNSCLIKADSNQLRQAFLNLFLNAIDAMPSGGTLTVSTRIKNRGSSIRQQLLICVQDTGYGIPKEDLPHIFEPFYSKKEEGTGLGLSIVYNIIKEHNGSIKAKSRLKEGTEFIIKLPLQ